MSIKSTAIFDFLLKKFQKLIKFFTQSYLFITSEFIFILKEFFCFLKSLDNYFFGWFAYKSLLSRFSVLISYNMCLLIIFPYPAVSHVFQGSGLSGSRFFKVQVFQGPGLRVLVQSLGPGSRVRVQVLEVAQKCSSYYIL